jgi:hypothetical protein
MSWSTATTASCGPLGARRTRAEVGSRAVSRSAPASASRRRGHELAPRSRAWLIDLWSCVCCRAPRPPRVAPRPGQCEAVRRPEPTCVYVRRRPLQSARSSFGTQRSGVQISPTRPGQRQFRCWAESLPTCRWSGSPPTAYPPGFAPGRYEAIATWNPFAPRATTAPEQRGSWSHGRRSGSLTCA